MAVIKDNTLEFTGNHVGGGEAHLVEGVIDVDTLDTLANKQVYINLGNLGMDKLVDHQVFVGFPPLARAHLEISKDFQLQTRSGANDNIFVSHFDQTFSQVPIPEPSSMLLLVTGILGLAGRRYMQQR